MDFFVLATFLGLSVVYTIYYAFKAVKPTQIHCHPDSPLQGYIADSSKLKRFYPSFLFINAHIQTIGSKLLRTAPNIEYQSLQFVTFIKREYIQMEDGGAVALDWDICAVNYDNNAPLAILLHGLVGSSTSKYVRNQLYSLRQKVQKFSKCPLIPMIRDGELVSLMQVQRGCGTSELKSPRFFNAGYTNDLRTVLKHIKEKYPNAPIYAIGFSLGANILSKYLGEERENTPIVGAVCVSSPFDLLQCSTSSSKLYNRVLTKDLQTYVLRHKQILSEFAKDFDWDGMLSAKTIYEFDQRCTCKMFGYSTVEEYYRESSSAPVLSHIKVPVLFLNAEDDPIVGGKVIPVHVAKTNPNVILAVTQRGGHIGYLQNFMFWSTSWTDTVAVEFFDYLLSNNNHNSKTSTVQDEQTPLLN